VLSSVFVASMAGLPAAWRASAGNAAASVEETIDQFMWRAVCSHIRQVGMRLQSAANGIILRGVKQPAISYALPRKLDGRSTSNAL
jgi:hypothetical protein